jgi:hypothetical protein
MLDGSLVTTITVTKADPRRPSSTTCPLVDGYRFALGAWINAVLDVFNVEQNCAN